MNVIIEPRRQKTGLRGFRPGTSQSGLNSHRRWLETWNFGLESRGIVLSKWRKQRRWSASAKLICVFVFAYAEIRFSHVAAQLCIYCSFCRGVTIPIGKKISSYRKQERLNKSESFSPHLRSFLYYHDNDEYKESKLLWMGRWLGGSDGTAHSPLMYTQSP